jgi:hypothetical protein
MKRDHDPKDANYLGCEPDPAPQAEPQGYRTKTEGQGKDTIFQRCASSDTTDTHHLQSPKQQHDIQCRERPGKPDITECITQNSNKWYHQQRWQWRKNHKGLAIEGDRIMDWHSHI